MTPSAEYAVLESWLRLGDVAIHGEGPGSFTSPLVGAPRVREGAPDDVVLARAEYVIDLYAPCLLPVDEPLSLLALADDGPVADSFLRVVRMRDVARQSTPDRPLDALLAVPPRPVDGEALLDLESHGRRWWT